MTEPVLVKYFNDVANAVDTPCLIQCTTVLVVPRFL